MGRRPSCSPESDPSRNSKCCAQVPMCLVMQRDSWLLRDGTDRERMVDMDRRLQPVRRAAFGVLGIALLACGPWLGWWTLAPLVLAAVLFRLADDRIERVRRPEYAIFRAWSASQVII